MDKKEFEALVNARMINEVGFVDFYMQNPSEMEKLTVKDLANIGTLSQPQANNFIIENGAANADGMSTEEFMELVSKGGYVKLVNDILDPEMISITNDVTIDLNGYSITKTTTTKSKKCVLFYVKGSGSKLTITGEGNVNVESGETDIAVWADEDSEVVIESGNFHGVGNVGGSDLIYAKDGKILVNGGTFKLDNMTEAGFAQPQYSLLNVYGGNVNNAKDYIIVTGGKFYRFDPSNNVSEGLNTNFVEDGYIVVQKGDFYEVVKDEIVVEE